MQTDITNRANILYEHIPLAIKGDGNELFLIIGYRDMFLSATAGAKHMKFDGDCQQIQLSPEIGEVMT